MVPTISDASNLYENHAYCKQKQSCTAWYASNFVKKQWPLPLSCVLNMPCPSQRVGATGFLSSLRCPMTSSPSCWPMPSTEVPRRLCIVAYHDRRQDETRTGMWRDEVEKDGDLGNFLVYSFFWQAAILLSFQCIYIVLYRFVSF